MFSSLGFAQMTLLIFVTRSLMIIQDVDPDCYPHAQNQTKKIKIPTGDDVNGSRNFVGNKVSSQSSTTAVFFNFSCSALLFKGKQQAKAKNKRRNN